MTSPIEAVIAGSKPFALALLAPLTARVGSKPLFTADAAQVLRHLERISLLVVELQGEASLRAVQALRKESAALRIVAAVPEAQAALEPTLRSLGVEAVRWEGKPDGVIAAVARLLEPAPQARAPAAPRPAQAIPPTATPGPGAAAAVPPTATPRPGAVAAVPPAAPQRPAAPPVAAPKAVPAAASAPAVPSPAAASPAAGLFDDVVPTGDFRVDLSDVGAPDAGAPLFAGGIGPWPSSVPGSVEAADALGRGLAGRLDPPGTPFGSVGEVLANLTDLERAVLTGAPQPIDTDPIRRAAVMRVRVAIAVATAPAPGGAVDAAAVSTLLGDIDALLSEVNALASAAPEELHPALEQVRNGLVKEAIDFSEAAHRAQPAEAVPEPEPQPVAPRGRAVQTRVVSVASKAEAQADEEQEKKRRSYWIVLAVAVVAAAAYHGWSLFTQRKVDVPLGVGSLSNATSVDNPSGRRIVQVPRGGEFSPEELARFKDEEALKGNAVREMGPGVLMVIPGGARATPPAAPTAAQEPAAAGSTTATAPGTAGATGTGVTPAASEPQERK